MRGDESPVSISRHGDFLDKAVGFILALSLVSLGLGLTLPVVRVDRFFVFTDRFSILGGIRILFGEGEIVVGLVVFLFSILFPLAKLIFAFLLWRWTSVHSPLFDRRAGRLEWLGKWSMVDVLVVALLVFSATASGVASANTEPGLYFFCAAVLGTAVAVARIKASARRLRAGQAPPAAAGS